MTLDEIKQYLRENLSVEIKLDFDSDYYGGGSYKVKVSLWLGDEKISESYSST